MKNLLRLIIAFVAVAVMHPGVCANDAKQDSILSELRLLNETQLRIRKVQDSIQNVRNQEMLEYKEAAEKRKSDIGILAQIGENTYEDFWKSGVTLIAVLGLIISLITLYAQWRTERHTKNVSIESQLGVLSDLPRHFYRNLVCTVAMLIKYRRHANKNGEEFSCYPSEANVLKLQTLPEEFILPIDTASREVYDVMHEQKLLFKNYNIEVAVASEHFARPAITNESLVNDFDNLLFKPLFLVAKIFKLNNAIEKKKVLCFEEEIARSGR